MMKKWNEPRIIELGVEQTADNCTTKDWHDHCDNCNSSSSSCNCPPWPEPPIVPGPGQS